MIIAEPRCFHVISDSALLKYLSPVLMCTILVCMAIRSLL